MRPASNHTTSGAGVGFSHWNSPMPYLFGGLALLLGIITVALIILACSYRQSVSNSATQVREETPVKQVDSSEPKIVVIMAGDENPTYLAKPKPVSCDCHNEEQV
ncbi:hypothetical protein P3X46_029614 [Hevea brasiliensis]|uniref:Uncharacterized protein n=1 Tax=Hevea brasiliensis TaxID=3981 RepID=A0ABQ9KSQ0_HEVBR|nr:protein GLUTAMINE DUMPER 3-like [Hevea brasiliensis]XP_057994675.1 protein GLUTAMINE DUMPER 3-like [Hevea brasiliensis]KAJ9147443.1 hypothetical protein P3X46_029605 [Hevea brasiliensis]KAJ9147452.1 hypothetical protein P3X46_029614 [Hevea brasiliensis]